MARLVNVRLDDERLRKAKRLRARGVVLSDLVREAIDARFEALGGSRQSGRARAIVARMLAAHPDPPGLPPRRYDMHDRRAARRAVARHLRSRPR